MFKKLIVVIGLLVSVVGCGARPGVVVDVVCEVDCAALQASGCYSDPGVLSVWPDASLEACRAACGADLESRLVHIAPQTAMCADKVRDLICKLAEGVV